MCRLSSSLCIYWVVCEYLWAYSLYVWMCVSVILAPGRQAGGCRGNPQLATQRITQLQCLTPARCPTQTHNLLNGIRCMRLTGPSATQAETLPWNSSHCIRTSVLLSHLYYLCVSECMCMWVCMRGQQRMFGKCHFLPQSDSTGGGSSPFPDSSPIALLDPCAPFLSNVAVISPRPKEWQTNWKAISPKKWSFSKNFFGDQPNSENLLSFESYYPTI